jgi:type 1 glutamine amidotransferase
MKKSHLLLLIAGLRLLAPAQAPFKMLIIAGTSDDHSPTSNAGRPVIEAMAATNNFTVDYSTDHGLLNDANLAKYQVFLQLNLYPFDLTTSERAALQKFVESGKGWVGIHAAGCAQAAWPWFMKFMGDVTFAGHANLRKGTLIFEDRTHPVTKNMPASLSITDEWYTFNKSPRPNVHVMAKGDVANYSPYDANGDRPLVWSNPSFTRMVYISIGHDPADWKVPEYISLVHDAIMWANPVATRLDPSGGKKGYLGSPSAGRAWIHDGMLNLGPGASGWEAGSIRLSDATGKRLSIAPVNTSAASGATGTSGTAQFKVLGAQTPGTYYLSATGLPEAMSLIVRP